MNQIVHFKRVFLQIVKLMQFVLGRGVFPAVLIESTLLEVDLKVTVVLTHQNLTRCDFPVGKRQKDSAVHV